MVCLRRMVCLFHMCIAARVRVRCVPCWLCCRVDYPLVCWRAMCFFAPPLLAFVEAYECTTVGANYTLLERGEAAAPSLFLWGSGRVRTARCPCACRAFTRDLLAPWAQCMPELAKLFMTMWWPFPLQL